MHERDTVGVKGVVGSLGRFQKISHNSFIYMYLAETLQHGIAKAYQIVGDFFLFSSILKDIRQKFSVMTPLIFSTSLYSNTLLGL